MASADSAVDVGIVGANAVFVGAGVPIVQTLTVGVASGSTFVSPMSPSSDSAVGWAVGDEVGMEVTVE